MSLSFDATFYQSQRPDVYNAFIATAGSTGLTWAQFAQNHYNTFGRFEGSDPSASFSTNYYLSTYPDVAAAGVNPFDHFLAFGSAEGRQPYSTFPTSSFDEATYLAANADVQAAVTAGTFANGYQHWVLNGQFESRPGAPTVDTPTVGEGFTLTNGIDTFTGGTGDDTFSGALNANGAVTFQSFDVLDGGAGTDTLVAQGIGSLTTSATTLQNIEVVEIVAQTAGSTIALANTTGITSLKVNTPAGNANFTGLNAGLTDVTVTGNATAGADTHTFTFANTAVSGATDALTLNVDGVGSAAANDILNLNPTSGANGLETLTVNGQGSGSFVTVNDGSSTSLTTVNVTGSTDLTLAVTPGTLTTFDASAATGDVTAALQTNTQTLTATGGAGDDDFNLAGAGFTKDDVIDGGAGTDTLRVQSATLVETDSHQVSNVEVLRVTDALGANLAVTNFGSSVAAVRFDADNGAARTISGLADTFEVDFRAAQTVDGLTTTFATTTGTQTLTLDLNGSHTNGGNSDLDFQGVTAAGVENITIESGASDAPDNA